jgi:ABC-type phosphate transport system substrate-binding protein
MKRILLTAALGTLLGVGAVQAQVIVANRGVKADAISKADLRDIFTGASSNYRDGSRAVPVTLRSGPAQVEFLRNIVGKSDAAFHATWRSVVFAGQGIMPQSFDSEESLIDYIATVPGAIGYVSASQNHDKVKTLTVK